MMRAVRFVKVEGAGNDYVLVEEFDRPVEDPSGLSRAVADRHAGVGSDGLLVVGPADAPAVARMRIFNADGSEGLMCGNGLRCVVRHLAASGRLTPGEAIVETASGPRRAVLSEDGAVHVHMGVPSFLPDALPCDLPGNGSAPARHPLPLGLEETADGAWAVSVGNPHLVLRVPDVEGFDLARHGTALQASPRLGDGANVHAVGVLAPGVLAARPWERGSGATRACGTGAVAVAAVARARGWVDGDLVDVRMPGGALGVCFDEDGSAWLSGPARLVFIGEWPGPAGLA